jgi:hypothetical protein
MIVADLKDRSGLPAGTPIIAISDGLRSDHVLDRPMDVSDASRICNPATGEERLGWVDYRFVERDGEFICFLARHARAAE